MSEQTREAWLDHQGHRVNGRLLSECPFCQAEHERLEQIGREESDRDKPRTWKELKNKHMSPERISKAKAAAEATAAEIDRDAVKDWRPMGWLRLYMDGGGDFHAHEVRAEDLPGPPAVNDPEERNKALHSAYLQEMSVRNWRRECEEREAALKRVEAERDAALRNAAAIDEHSRELAKQRDEAIAQAADTEKENRELREDFSNLYKRMQERDAEWHMSNAQNNEVVRLRGVLEAMREVVVQIKCEERSSTDFYRQAVLHNIDHALALPPMKESLRCSACGQPWTEPGQVCPNETCPTRTEPTMSKPDQRQCTSCGAIFYDDGSSLCPGCDRNATEKQLRQTRPGIMLPDAPARVYEMRMNYQRRLAAGLPQDDPEERKP